MLDFYMDKSNIVRNFRPSLNQIIIGINVKDLMVSSEALKILKVQLCEEYKKNSLTFHFKIPHNAGLEKFFEKFLAMLERKVRVMPFFQGSIW